MWKLRVKKGGNGSWRATLVLKLRNGPDNDRDGNLNLRKQKAQNGNGVSHVKSQVLEPG